MLLTVRKRASEIEIKLCPKTHRKFKRQPPDSPGAATPIVHRRRRRCASKVQRRDSAADAPQHVLRGRNDGPPDGVPGHGPQLPDPRAQGGRLPAGQPDEPAEHPAQRQSGPASVIKRSGGRHPGLVVDKSSYLKQANSTQFILVLLNLRETTSKLYAIFRWLELFFVLFLTICVRIETS